jgi:hypothetical protein
MEKASGRAREWEWGWPHTAIAAARGQLGGRTAAKIESLYFGRMH